MEFTEEQLKAINTEGTNIIVSAGAGSGKTAVLTQRVIRKIKNGIPVNKLLVLTFTNEAANEMKNRIRKAIIKNNLKSQLELLDSSYITTFDSFSLSVVKKYHYLLNLKKDIKIIDENIIIIYKYKIIDQIFESLYGNKEFDTLINDFCLKDDKTIKDIIIEASKKFDLVIDKEKYLNDYLNKFYNEEYIKELLNNYNKIIKNKIDDLSELYQEFSSYISNNLKEKLDLWFSILFNSNNYDEYVRFKNYQAVRFTKVEEEGYELRDLIKEKIAEINKLLRFDSSKELVDSIKSTESYAKVLIEIIKKLDQSVIEYKIKNNLYEFDDIAKMAIKIIKNNNYVKEELTKQFNEIMVDEYQDTSSIQEEFINLISSNNVYMVGDIKQSIYRFRNANPYIFQEKYNQYNNEVGGIKIDLLNNFRSREETIYNINEIFNLIMDDEIGAANYQLSHNMVFKNKAYNNEKSGNNNYLEIYNYDSNDNEYTKEEKEIFIISKDIKEKIKNKYQIFDKETEKLRDLKYSDICIITDRNKYLDKYRKILEYNEIPSTIYMDEFLTNDMVILVLKNLINLVDHVNRGILDNKFKYYFVSVARSFLFNYDDNQIYKIVKNTGYKETEIYKLAKEINIDEPIRLIINNIIEKFGIYDKLTNLYDIDKELVRIDNLIEIGDSLNSMGYNLKEFNKYFDEVVEYGLKVKYSTIKSNNNAVKIMNIHKSKGLEFPICYFTGMHNQFTIKELTNKIITTEKYGMIIPYLKDGKLEPTIIKDIYANDFLKEEISEKIRLFYVALTRCREKMIIVTSLEDKPNYNNIVPIKARMKYRSFLDILSSLSITKKYFKEIKYNCTHDYDTPKVKDLKVNASNHMIIKKEISIDPKEIKRNHYSKELLNIATKEQINFLDYGNKIHEEMEYANFNDSQNEYVINLLKHIPNNYINIYKEFEFINTKDSINSHGIIDLIIEYDNDIYIIDYKLKNISDVKYKEQLSGYKKYLETISNKQISTYLYSLLEDDFVKIE